MAYQLICEGPCNPNIGAVDRLALKDRDSAAQLQRRLRYTPHELIGENLASCRVCQTVRGYGRTFASRQALEPSA